MSTFTRTTTPPYSANPLQTFVTCKQARRAARGASPIAFLLAALSAGSQMLLMATPQYANLTAANKLAALVIAAALVGGFLLLGWRSWARPGPWKIAPILVFLVLDAASELFRFAVVNLVVVGVILNFSVIAFRGALAMKRLQGEAQMQADLDVF